MAENTNPAKTVTDKRVPALALARDLLRYEAITPDKQTLLAERSALMKEDIIREATMRTFHLRDKEECSVLETVLNALGGEATMELPTLEDARACRELIAERLKFIRQRRPNLEGNSATQNLKTDKDREGGKGVKDGKDVKVLRPLHTPKPILTAEFWSNLTGLEVSTSLEAVQAFLKKPMWEGDSDVPTSINSDAWIASLESRGWSDAGVPSQEFAAVAKRVHAATLKLREAGWPPAFVFMSDEAWWLAAHVQKVVGGLLTRADQGTEAEHLSWHLEPSFAAFLLDAGHDNFNGKRAGNNFPLPHRDHCYSMAFDSQGRRKLISVWMPITDVEVDSGCMYVVPREFDPSFRSDAAYHHMALLSQGEHDVAEQSDDTARGTWSSLTKTTLCGFPLAGARPLPCPCGTILSWNANLIHWGSFCQSGAAVPRASLAFVLRRCGGSKNMMSAQVSDPSVELLDMTALSAQDSMASVRWRLTRVLSAMRYFEHWYDAKGVHDRVTAALKE